MTEIYFGKLEIGAIDGESAVNYGRNVVIGMHSQEKENEAFGKLGGERNVLGHGWFEVRDEDTMDMWLSRTRQARERLSRLTSTE